MSDRGIASGDPHGFYKFALALFRAQQRMLDRWAEGDAAVRQQLWRDLHERGEDLFLAASSNTVMEGEEG